MDKNQQPVSNAALEKAKALAGSPVGQQLYEFLQQQGGENFQKAMAQASAGDLNAAKQALSQLMANPEARELLQKLGR